MWSTQSNSNPFSDNVVLFKHRALADSGALSGNYVGIDIVDKLRSVGFLPVFSNNYTCSPIGGCVPTNESYSFTIEFFNELKNFWEPLPITASLLPGVEGLIIGRPLMIEADIIYKTPTQWRRAENLMKNSTRSDESMNTRERRKTDHR